MPIQVFQLHQSNSSLQVYFHEKIDGDKDMMQSLLDVYVIVLAP